MAIARRKTGKYNCIFFNNKSIYTLFFVLASSNRKSWNVRVSHKFIECLSHPLCRFSRVDIKRKKKIHMHTVHIHPFYGTVKPYTGDYFTVPTLLCVFCSAFIYTHTHTQHTVSTYGSYTFSNVHEHWTRHICVQCTTQYTIFKTNLLSVSLNRIQRPLYHNKSEQWACSHGANRMHLSNS